MNNIIKALVTALYQHECWDDDVIADETSANALSEVAGILKEATPEEISCLEGSLIKMAASTTDPDFSDYCLDFVDLFIKKYDDNWF